MSKDAQYDHYKICVLFVHIFSLIINDLSIPPLLCEFVCVCVCVCVLSVCVCVFVGARVCVHVRACVLGSNAACLFLCVCSSLSGYFAVAGGS